MIFICASKDKPLTKACDHITKVDCEKELKNVFLTCNVARRVIQTTLISNYICMLLSKCKRPTGYIDFGLYTAL
jgi:hypothetical protein